MPRTREPPPRQDVPGQSMLFPPGDCPPHPAGPRDGRGLPWWYRADGEGDARRTEAIRKRDERREAKR
jgi:hypothetical protein